MKIKVEKTDRYVEWCDNHWYGTTRDIERAGDFTAEEAETIRKQMLDHYVCCLVYVHDDGREELVHYKSSGHAITENIDDYIKTHPLNDDKIVVNVVIPITEIECKYTITDDEVLWD